MGIALLKKRIPALDIVFRCEAGIDGDLRGGQVPIAGIFGCLVHAKLDRADS